MCRRRSRLAVSLFLLVSPCVAFAQKVANNPSLAEKPESPAEKRAYELLDTLAGRIITLRAPENRIYMQCAVADLLWSRDEKRARALFETLTKDITALVAGIDASEQDAYNSFAFVYQLRQEVMTRLARRDPEMALSFLRSTRLQSPDLRVSGPDGERNLELQLAGLIAASDPQRSLRMARARLSKGLSYPLVTLLTQIHTKDPAAARDLHKEMVDRLRDEDLTRNQEAFNAAWNLVGIFQPPQANEETYKELLEILSNAILSVTPGDSFRQSSAQNLYNQMQSYMPQISKYAPARAAAVQQWFQSVERTFDPSAKIYRELNELSQKSGTAEDIIAMAQKYPAEYQTQIYQQAALKALSSGNPDRARQIATDFIADTVQRGQMLAQIDQQLLWNNVNENKVAEARRMLRKARSVEQKVQILTQLASNVASKGDKPQALELLNEARAYLAAPLQTSAKLSAQLQLARSYASLDLDQSFALMQGVITQVNQLIGAAAVLDGVENRYLQEGEWMRRGYTGLSNLVNNIDQNLGFLATQNVESALTLSDQLERPEVRLMAQLDIAQVLLGANSGNLPIMGRGFVQLRR